MAQAPRSENITGLRARRTPVAWSRASQPRRQHSLPLRRPPGGSPSRARAGAQAARPAVVTVLVPVTPAVSGPPRSDPELPDPHSPVSIRREGNFNFNESGPPAARAAGPGGFRGLGESVTPITWC